MPSMLIVNRESQRGSLTMLAGTSTDKVVGKDFLP